MNRPTCQGISSYSMPSLQPAAMAPTPAAMPVLISAPPSSVQTVRAGGCEQARQQPQDHAEGRVGDPAVQHRLQVHRADAPEGEPGLLHQPVGRVQLDRRRQPRHRTQQQPEAGEGREHEHRKGGRLVRHHPRLQVGGVGVWQRLGMRRLLQLALAFLAQGRVVDAADFAAREDHRRGGRVLHQQALAQRPDEDEQSDDGQQEGPEQADDGAVHHASPSATSIPRLIPPAVPQAVGNPLREQVSPFLHGRVAQRGGGGAEQRQPALEQALAEAGQRHVLGHGGAAKACRSAQRRGPEIDHPGQVRFESRMCASNTGPSSGSCRTWA